MQEIIVLEKKTPIWWLSLKIKTNILFTFTNDGNKKGRMKRWGWEGGRAFIALHVTRHLTKLITDLQ